MAGRDRPGSVPWLLAADMRLAWRDFRSTFRGLGRTGLALLIGVVVIVMHAAAWPVAVEFGALADLPGQRAEAELQAAPLVAFVLLLMLAQTLNGVTKLLYGRGDLDLILSSPVSPQRVFFVRSLAVVAGALTSAGIFIVPLADAGVMTGRWTFLAVYPTLVGCGLLSATLGILIALGLFRWIGPKATRLAAQILATFIGAAFMLALQLHKFLPAISGPGIMAGIRGAPFGLGTVLLLPIHAALGEPWPLAAWVLSTAVVFWLAAWVTGRRFALSAQAAASVDWGSGPRARAGRPGRSAAFRLAPGVSATLRRKEWRLIARDPWIVSQVLLQILYMTPMVALLWTGAGPAAFALAPMIVVVAFQVASSLTWLSLSGEDAPELLATAPVSAGLLLRGKLEAVGIATLGIVALPLVWLVLLSARAGGATLVLAVFGIGNAVLLQIWHGKPARRSAFAARHRESKLLAMVEMALSMMWGISAALVVARSLWAAIPLALVGAILLCCRPRRAAIPA